MGEKGLSINEQFADLPDPLITPIQALANYAQNVVVAERIGRAGPRVRTAVADLQVALEALRRTGDIR